MKIALRAMLALCLLQLLLITSSGGAEASSAKSCPSTWTVVPSPGPGVLIGVTKVFPNNVWAVGQAFPVPLIEHWNGRIWSVTASPQVAGGFLRSVSPVSASDVWAVGTDGGDGTLSEHWNGTAWSVVPTVNPGSASNELNGVSGPDPNDEWAVGSESNGTSGNALVEHWDGSSWRDVSPPNTPVSLEAVKAIASNNVWAIGHSGVEGDQEVTLHWNGKGWTRYGGEPGNNFIFIGLMERSHRLPWAAGESSSGGEQFAQMFKWNGFKKAWVPVTTQLPAGQDSSLSSTVQVSPTNVWAVGAFAAGSNHGTSLVEHSDGSGFTIDPAGEFLGVDVTAITSTGGPPQVLWAVGFTSVSNVTVPFIMTRCAN